MRKGEATRNRMVAGATRLVARQGYAATGLKEVLSESGAPRGSLYNAFPGGKEELGVAVVEAHAEAFGVWLEQTLASAPDLVEGAQRIVEGLAQQVQDRGCDAGCPVGAIAFEMAGRSEPLARAVEAAFERWRIPLTLRLKHAGVPEDEARSRARVLLSAVEGALVLARAYGNRGPLDDLSKALPSLLPSNP